MDNTTILTNIAFADWNTQGLDYYGKVYNLDKPSDDAYCPAGRGIISHKIQNAVTSLFNLFSQQPIKPKPISLENQKADIATARQFIKDRLNNCYDLELCNNVKRKYNQLIDKKGLDSALKFYTTSVKVIKIAHEAPKEIEYSTIELPVPKKPIRMLQTHILSLPVHSQSMNEITTAEPKEIESHNLVLPIQKAVVQTVSDESRARLDDDDVVHLGMAEDESEEAPVRQYKFNVFGGRNKPLDRFKLPQLKIEDRKDSRRYSLRKQTRVDYYASHHGRRYI